LPKQLHNCFFLFDSLQLDSVGNVIGHIHKVNRWRTHLISTCICDHLQMGKPCKYVTSQPSQLGLPIPPVYGQCNKYEHWTNEQTPCTRRSNVWFCSVNWCLAEG